MVNKKFVNLLLVVRVSFNGKYLFINNLTTIFKKPIFKFVICDFKIYLFKSTKKVRYVKDCKYMQVIDQSSTKLF